MQDSPYYFANIAAHVFCWNDCSRAQALHLFASCFQAQQKGIQLMQMYCSDLVLGMLKGKSTGNPLCSLAGPFVPTNGKWILNALSIWVNITRARRASRKAMHGRRPRQAKGSRDLFWFGRGPSDWTKACLHRWGEQVKLYGTGM